MATDERDYLGALDWIVMGAAFVCLVVVLVLLRRYPPEGTPAPPPDGGE